jgi:hypothetical protein
VAKRAQLKPEFANSIDECTDTSKLYVLPDGYIYAWMLTEVEAGPAYTNLLFTSTDTDRKTIFNGTGYKIGVRISGSSGLESSTGNPNQGITGFIPATAGQTLRIKNVDTPSGNSADYVIAYNSSNTMTGKVQNPAVTNRYYEIVLSESTFGSGFNAIRLCFNNLNAETIVTLDEEITDGTGTILDYAWANTGKAFVPADYEDRIIVVETKADANTEAIQKLKSNSLMFISPTGNDSNSGLTASAPKKTVSACVNAGATRISAKRGVYNENIQLWNVEDLEIFPTDNDKTFVLGEDREKIVFDTSDTIAVSSLATYNSIKRVAYSNTANTQFDKVFISKSQPAIVSDYGNRFNSTVWVMSDDEKTVCNKLKPVLTIAECEAEANTFTHIDGYIYINSDVSEATKIVVPTNWGTGFYINGVQRFVLREVEVRFSGAYNIDIRNCAYFDFYKCACKYTSYASGFHPFNSNGIMTACYATKNYDGYGISGHGHTTYVDCVSEFNFDDGMSHHNACEGTVIGGRYEGNGKGGNTPAYGAKVNIYGGLYKDNASFGIGYLWATDLEPASGMVQGAVMVGNPVGLVVNANCPVTAMSCVYKNNTTDKENKGLLTEY